MSMPASLLRNSNSGLLPTVQVWRQSSARAVETLLTIIRRRNYMNLRSIMAPSGGRQKSPPDGTRGAAEKFTEKRSGGRASWRGTLRVRHLHHHPPLQKTDDPRRG